jgi:hypothetical protein
MATAPSREVEIDPHHAALLIVDVQNYTARRDGGEYRDLKEREIEERFGFFFQTMEATTLRCATTAATPGNAAPRNWSPRSNG